MRMRGPASLVAALVLAVQPVLVVAVPADVSSDPEVVRGVKQVDDGEYDEAIFTLDAAARRLAADPQKVGDLAQAYLYLGIAYMGKGHQAAAHAKFREAVQQIRDISLSPDRFPPKVIDALEAARTEVKKSAGPTTATSAPPPVSTGKKGGSGKTLLIVGGLAAAGGAVALAGGGGGGSSGGPSTPVDNRRTDTFTGTTCGNYEACSDDVYRNYEIVVSAAGTLDASVTWANPAYSYNIELKDENFQVLTRSNRTTNTQAQLSASVTPRTSSPSAAYIVTVYRNDGDPTFDAFTLTVRHP